MPQATTPEQVRKLLPSLALDQPIWSSPTVHRESVLFVKEAEGRAANARLLFPAEKILAVEAANRQASFELGRDLRLAEDERTLELPEDSRIGRLTAEQLFPPIGAERSIAAKAGDPKRGVLFDNAHWFHDLQVEVTYTRKPADWPGKTPRFSPELLPRTIRRLRSKERLVVAVSGDSISQGYNASLYSQAPPGMPPYPDLVAAQLRHVYGGEVVLHNRAIAGWNVPRGLNDLDALLALGPKLVIIAYGMNDVGGRNPPVFRTGIATMLERIKARDPEIEVILVSPMLGNENWVHTPREMFPQYRDALASFEAPGIALADLTDVWQVLLAVKRDVDLTGNGVNHPNDFGHRLYAEAILALLVEPREKQP